MKSKRRNGSAGIAKAPSGISGLDEITFGGLPRGRSTLVCGRAGCGKTLFAMEFLLRGALEHGEPGVFMSFEESEKDLVDNVRSLGFDLDRLVERKQIALDYVHIDRSEIEETGAQEAREKAAHTGRAHELTRKQRDLRRRRAGIDAQMAALRAEVQDIDGEARILREQDEAPIP